MRKGIFFIVLAIVLCAVSFSSVGCTDKKPTPTDSDSVVSAVGQEVVDTMEQIIAETPMPKAADELFDDFFFNFAANRKLQMKRIHFHDLRHEATSRFVEKGLSDTKVRTITGHKSPQMLARYAHLRAEDLVAELDDRQGHSTVPASARLNDRPQNTGKSAKIVPFRPQRVK